MLEDYVVVEVGAVVEARRVGEGSVIEVNAKVGKGVVMGKVCICHLSTILHPLFSLQHSSTGRVFAGFGGG